jgi:hypothetical protein
MQTKIPTDLAHKAGCAMAFGRKDTTCPRCQELIAGAPARKGWQHDYFKAKKRAEEQRLDAIKNHDCKKSRCGYQCTAFDH